MKLCAFIKNFELTRLTPTPSNEMIDIGYLVGKLPQNHFLIDKFVFFIVTRLFILGSFFFFLMKKEN